MDIIMPKMGESVSEGTIIKWHKKPGDPVKRDEIIFEISTDKVDTEIPAPADGFLSEIKVGEGETVEVGTVVAVLSSEATDSSSAPEEMKGETKEEKVVEEDTEAESVPEKLEETSEITSEANVQEPEGTGNDGENLIEITMPKMGESVMEGTIIKWHKKVGEPVKKDETIFEISTDKVDTEVPSPSAGTLAEILVAEQETVEVGTIVAKLATGDYASSKVPKAKPVKDTKLQPEEKQQTVQAVSKAVPASAHDNFSNVSVPDVHEETEKAEGSKFYSPLVLNIAQKENVSFAELEKIKGTGLEGRVSKKDILGYIESRGKQKAEPVKELVTEQPAKAAAAPKAIAYPQSYSTSDVEKIPMDNIRQKIMQHMIASRDASVHVSAMLEVDMGKIYNFIQSKKEEFIKSKGVKLTYMPFIANAVVRALKEYPLVNSMIEGSTIVKKKFINLGIAVAIEPAGLIVPNIKNADEKNIIGLAKSISDIAERSRTKKLSPDDISNGTFTITNYGVFGTLFGTPIINQPEVAILGVGAVVKRPVVIEADGTDTIAIKPIMALTLSHDHRLVDGMLGGKFLKFIKDNLENFDQSVI